MTGEHTRETPRCGFASTCCQDAGVLSEIGTEELSAIKERHDYLNREVEDRDFFGTYSSSSRRIAGDPTPIIKVPDYDRLRVAQELAQSPDFDLQEGWSAFCRSHPHEAFYSLCSEDVTAANVALWNQFLFGLVSGDEASKTIRDGLAVQAFDHLSKVDLDILRPMVFSLSDLIRFGPPQHLADIDAWLERLWQIVSEQPEEPLDLSSDLYDKAVNSVAGRLADALLLEMDSKRQQGVALSSVHRQLVRRIADHEGTVGQLGRAVMTRNVSFLLSVGRDCVIDILGPRISASDEEGAALRAVMLSCVSISPELTQLLGQAIKKGAVESEHSGHEAARVAANVLLPGVGRGSRGPLFSLGSDSVGRCANSARSSTKR